MPGSGWLTREYEESEPSCSIRLAAEIGATGGRSGALAAKSREVGMWLLPSDGWRNTENGGLSGSDPMKLQRSPRNIPGDVALSVS